MAIRLLLPSRGAVLPILLKRDKHGSQWRILDRGCKEGAAQALVDSSGLRFGAWRDGSAGGHADPEAIHITDAGAGRTSSCLRESGGAGRNGRFQPASCGDEGKNPESQPPGTGDRKIQSL